jgi:TRAP-type C4-dicarboxylate transport system permease small subunit
MTVSKKKFSFESYIAALLLISLTVLLTLQVVARFGFNTGVSWSEELSRYFYVWAIYFGCVLATREDKHIRVTAQLDFLPKKLRAWIITLGDIVWIIFGGVVTYFGFQMVLSMFEYPFYSQTMGFNLMWIYAIVPLGYALMTVHVVRLVIRRIKKLMKKEDVEIADSRLIL